MFYYMILTLYMYLQKQKVMGPISLSPESFICKKGLFDHE